MALMLGSASPAPATSEQELIEAARVGDDRAFEELYARYRERIDVFIRGRIRDQARAEDVGQEVFISALRRLRSSDQEIAFKPWIYEIAKNACIDEHRRSQRRHEVSLDADGELSSGHGALLSIAPTPPAAVESKQKLDDLRSAFGGLSKSHHQLLVMREFEGLSYDEIGRRMGMSRQVVESALFRARRKLGVEYEELASGRRCLQVQSAIEAGKLSSRRSLGVRERRQLARHLAHCQPCRVKAHLAGVDQAALRSGLGAKIAALLPLPALRWWPFGRATRAAGVRTGTHPGLQTAAGALEPAGSALLGGAAVAVAALAIAGSGAIGATATHRTDRAPRARGPGYSTPSSPASSPFAADELSYASGFGTANQIRPANGVERLIGFPSLSASALRRHSAQGSSSAPARGPSRGPAGRPAAGKSLASAAPHVSAASPGVPTSTVTKAVAPVQQVAKHAIQSVGKAIDLTPRVKSVAKVFGTVPSTGGTLPGLPSTSPAAPGAAPGVSSTATGTAATVKSVVTNVSSLAAGPTGLSGH
jgi:RNA polymerase sigma factor (sigma-70 family)